MVSYGCHKCDDFEDGGHKGGGCNSYIYKFCGYEIGDHNCDGHKYSGYLDLLLYHTQNSMVQYGRPHNFRVHHNRLHPIKQYHGRLHHGMYTVLHNDFEFCTTIAVL